jgi:hypothetical protein
MIGGWVWGWLIAVVAREIYEREKEGASERERKGEEGKTWLLYRTEN